MRRACVAVDLAIKSSFDLNNIGWARAGRVGEVAVVCALVGPPSLLPSPPPSDARQVKTLARPTLWAALAVPADPSGVGAASLPLMIDHVFTKISGNEKDRGALLRLSNLSAIDFCSSPRVPG